MVADLMVSEYLGFSNANEHFEIAGILLFPTVFSLLKTETSWSLLPVVAN